MTRDDIIRMAGQVYGTEDFHESALHHLTLFAQLVAEAEREACADLCDQMALYTGVDCADAIRARGQQ